MPVTLDIDHEARLVTAHVQGEAGTIEGISAIARIITSGAIPYAKLLDFSYAKPEEGARSIRQISSYLGKFVRGKKPGPIAFVTTSEILKDMFALFDRQMQVNRPMRIFSDVASAKAWLESLRQHPADERQTG
jgi:hypothetical protein